MLVVNHRFGHNVADEVLRQRLVVRMRIAHDEPRRSDRDTPRDCGDVQTEAPAAVSAVLASMLSKVREAASREA